MRFKPYINKVEDYVARGSSEGISILSTPVHIFLYADDIILISESHAIHLQAIPPPSGWHIELLDSYDYLGAGRFSITKVHWRLCSSGHARKTMPLNTPHTKEQLFDTISHLHRSPL